MASDAPVAPPPPMYPPQSMPPQMHPPPPRSNRRMYMIALAVVAVIALLILIFTFVIAPSGNGAGAGAGPAGTGTGAAPGERPGRTFEGPEETPEGEPSATGCPHPAMVLDDSGSCVCGGAFITNPEEPSECICKEGTALDPNDLSRCIGAIGGASGTGPIVGTSGCPSGYVFQSPDSAICIPAALAGQQTPQSQIPTIYGYAGMMYNGSWEDIEHRTGSATSGQLLGCMSEMHQMHKNSRYGPDWNIGNFATADSPEGGCRMYKAPDFSGLKKEENDRYYCENSCLAQYPEHEFIITTQPLKDGNGNDIPPTNKINPDGSFE